MQKLGGSEGRLGRCFGCMVSLHTCCLELRPELVAVGLSSLKLLLVLDSCTSYACNDQNQYSQ